MTQTHNEYFIEKDQLPVVVTMVTGEELSGLLFVQPSWRRPSLVYDAPAILNGDAYFPLQVADGSTRLLAKANVVTLRGTTAESESGEDVPGDLAMVSITCTNGAAIHGSLVVPRIAPNMRVLDFLNRAADEFIVVHALATAVLVNRRHIMLVTDESNGAA